MNHPGFAEAVWFKSGHHAATIVDAAFGGWAMRRTPKGEASLLRKLRRFMPARPVDGSLRKTFGLV